MSEKNEIKEKFFEKFYWLHFDAIKKHTVKKMKKIKALEVGCQTAYFSAAFANAGAECTCIDNEEKELSKGKKLFKELGLKADFKLMDGFDLKFKDNSFDIVFNHGVIEHFLPEKQDIMLKEMARVSRDLIYVSVPNRWHNESRKILKDSMHKRKTKTGFAWERNFYPFTFSELRNAFERNNIEVLELFGSIHWFKKNKTISGLLQKTLGLALGFELCILGRKKKK